ncbi:FecR family protein [Brucella pseudogrignonensis]
MPAKTMPDDHHDLAEQALHWIVRLNSGESDPEQHKAFTAWRSSSLLNEQAAQEAEALWNAMSGLHVDPNNGLMRLSPLQSRVSRRHVLKGIAVVSAVSTVGAGLWASGMMRRLSADHVSMTAEIRTIDLDDGSRVLLNARSAIDVKFTPAFRRVVLHEGQAYFEVAPDQARPFEVRMGECSVVALGTAFDVSRNLVDALAEVAVTEHGVLVRSQSGQIREIAAGQSVAIDKAGALGPTGVQDIAVTTAWRDGVYIAQDRSLGDIVAALAAWYPGLIYLRDPALAELRVNTVLDLHDPVASLTTLQAGLPIRIRHYSSYLSVILPA